MQSLDQTPFSCLLVLDKMTYASSACLTQQHLSSCWSLKAPNLRRLAELAQLSLQFKRLYLAHDILLKAKPNSCLSSMQTFKDGLKLRAPTAL